MWKLNGGQRKDMDMTNLFRTFMTSLGYTGNLTAYVKCDGSPFLAQYIIGIRDKIAKEDWHYLVAMFGGILYTKFMIDSELIQSLCSTNEVKLYNIPFGIFDVKNDALELLKLCEPALDLHKNNIINGLTFGFELVNTMFNSLSDLLVPSDTTETADSTEPVEVAEPADSTEPAEVAELTEVTKMDQHVASDYKSIIGEINDDQIQDIYEHSKDEIDDEDTDLILAMKLMEESPDDFDDDEELSKAEEELYS